MKLLVNSSQIKNQTAKAVAVSLPDTNGKIFWIPKSLVYTNEQGTIVTLYVPETMRFRIMRKHHFIEEVDADYIAEKLKAVNNTLGKDKVEKVEYIHHKPEEKEMVKHEADDSLKR